MLKDTDFDSPEVHEAFQKMLMEIPWSKLEEIIKSKRSFRKEFQEKGHHYVSKNKKRAAEIIEKDSEKNLEKINCLFKKWYDNKPEYQYIPKPFSESLEYCELKENNKIEAGQLEKPDDDKFDELAVALSKEHGMYFLYFSPINFSDKQAKRLIELTEQDEGEKVHILRKIVFDRNEKIVDLKINEEYENEVENAKKEKDVLELKWSQTEKEIKKLLGELEQKDESIKGLKRQLQDLKEISGTRTYEIDSLKRKNQQLVNKANELEKLKKEGLAEFIASKREEIERELISVQQFLKENKDSLHNILKQIEQEKQNRDALVEINELKRKELFEYMDNGERWKKALYPHSKQERLSMDSCGLAFQKWDEEKTIIEIFSELKTLLDNSGLSTDEIIRFKQSLKQLAREKIYRTNTLEEINQVGRFFQVLGHANGRFILNADASWLTPEFFWDAKGFLAGCEQPVTFPEIVTLAGQNSEIIFQVEILGADRAPLEGYLGPLLKLVGKEGKLVIKDNIVKIPRNILLFLQLDRDEYCAPISKWLDKQLTSINIPSINVISKNIFVPAYVWFEEVK